MLFVNLIKGGSVMSFKNFLASLSLAAVLALPALGSAATFAVWLDGNTTSGGGGNGIVTSLANAFGVGSFDLVSTSQLETPGFLNNYKTVIVSRFDSAFGSALSATAAANIASYVGSGATQGGVALFTNDAADNFFGATTGDPFDANLDRLFTNAATFAAASGHGYIGEFNGAVMAMNSNSAGFPAMGLITGSANAVHGTSTPNGHFIYDVGPIGAGNPIDAGITFPFTDADVSLFRTDVTGALSGNIVDIFDDNGLPAVLANQAVINPPSSVPEPGTLLLLGLGALGGIFARKRMRHVSV